MFCKKIITAWFCFYSLSAFGVVAPYLKEKESYALALNSYTLVAITFHYDETRFCYLQKVLECLSTFPKVDIVIITNTRFSKKIEKIQQCIKKVLPLGKGGGSVSIKSCDSIKHPYDLTWCHKELIPNVFLDQKKGYSHFVYLEDDIGLNFNNFCYFVHFREFLKPIGLLPAFLRVEINQKGEVVATDNYYKLDVSRPPKIFCDKMVFLNPLNPYMACFILDRELAEEYVETNSFYKDKSTKISPWQVRERAAMGLCFENIPKPFSSRYVVPLALTASTPNQKSFLCCDFSLIYHLPNTYANDPKTFFGKTAIQTLFFAPENDSIWCCGEKADD